MRKQFTIAVAAYVVFVVGLCRADDNHSSKTARPGHPARHLSPRSRGRLKSGDRFVAIATVSSKGNARVDVGRALDAANIEWGYWGSLTYAIYVSEHDRARAIKLIVADSRIHHYDVIVDTSAHPRYLR